MQNQLLITIDKINLADAIEYLKKITFIESAKPLIQEPNVIADSKFKSLSEFYEGYGIGKNSPASLNEIRKKAWARKK